MTNYSDILKEIVDYAVEKLKTMEESIFDLKSDASKWSKKEILGHLLDSAYNNHQRFLRASTQSDLIFQGYDQDEWVRLNGYQNRSFTDILSTWQIVNLHLSHLIEQLPEEIMSRSTTKHTFHLICMNCLKEEESTSLSYLVWDYLYHLEHHLRQIIPNLKKMTHDFEN